jgi:ribosomal protein L29
MKDYINKTEAELAKLASEKREAIQAFYLGLSGGKVKNVREARNLRREIARILTALKIKAPVAK